jgi:hypothetical protein
MSDDLLKRARQWADRFGPSNYWIGEGGEAAAMVYQLLEVIEAKQQEIASLQSRGNDSLESIHIHGFTIEERSDPSK